VGLIAEFPRPEGQLDGLRWFCPKCETLVHEVNWRLKKIDEDLAIIMNNFWNGPAETRTCRACGHVIQRAGAIAVKSGKHGVKVVAAPTDDGKARKIRPGSAKPGKAGPKAAAKPGKPPARKAPGRSAGKAAARR
jgi:hypothetical protein